MNLREHFTFGVLVQTQSKSAFAFRLRHERDNSFNVRDSMKWHLLLLLLFGVEFFPCLNATSSKAADDSNNTITTPPYFDSWCKEYCSSWETCNTVFGGNYVDLRLRVGYAIDDGPGRHSLLDKYFGNTISRQSFETQFILDVSSTIPGFSPCHIHVTNVSPEGNDKYWDANSVLITFRLFPADANVVATLTRLIQDSNSILYEGHVTRATDPLYGLVAMPWDQSLKLMFSISVIGGDDVVDSSHGQYLNHGSRYSCLDASQSNSMYCVFEKYIVNDIERALDLAPGQFIVLFIKEADKQSVIVSFRVVPQTAMYSTGQDVVWVQSKVMELVGQMADFQSMLYSGNVTFKVDPTWGVSGQSKRLRQFTSKYLSRPAKATASDAYERCKATQRCPRASGRYDQSSAHSSHTLQTYQHGEHINVSLFLDFEDWRRGIRGWEQSCRDEDTDFCLPSSEINGVNPKPAGAHWSPFDFDALGPSVPTFGNRWNNGLVLNKKLVELNIKDQNSLVKEYESLVVWMDREFNYGVTDDAMLRTRREIRDNIPNYTNTIEAGKGVLSALSQSQCSTTVVCSLVFNTSDASLSGAVNATGVITNTSDGTEVALWAFDSIDIDEHVTITVTGQRAMALLSRSSVHINTTLQASPGTLGGFPGGISVARHQRDRLVSVCNEGVDSRQFLDVCPGDVLVRELGKGIKSNNVNGPGSPSTRVYLMTVQTTSPIINEIQSLTTSADQGQTLSGGFLLHYNGYSTPLLKHDITAGELKRLMEDSLNPSTQLREYDRTDSATTPSGIGTVAVTRELFGSGGGYQWNITFVSAVGDIGNDSTGLTTTNYLQSKGARVKVKTIRHGNSIGGMFALQFLGFQTRLINHDVSASELTDILLLDIPFLSSAEVLRSDPTNNCNDGHCDNGVGRSGGYTWTLTLTTSEGNVTPFSPTSRLFNEEGEVANMTSLNQLSGCVDDQCPTIHIEMGHSKSNTIEMRSIGGTKPFSIAYGGAGAGYGGAGGVGFDDALPSGKAYGDERISNLWAGSGGGVGIKQPFQLGVFNQPRFRGGSGGGAIEIVGLNDIVLGSNSIISCDGESGSDGYISAGGGGSGGAILLSAGGVVRVDGKLSVLGGAGGFKKSKLPNKFGGHGGGGSGGRVAVYGQSVMIRDTSNVHLDGGDCGGASKTAQNCKGMVGTLFVESALDSGLTIDDTIGAAGTRRSLFLSPRMTRPSLNPQTLLPLRRSTPEYDLGSSVRPSRVSFHFRVQPSELGWDATFELRESRWSYLSSKSSLEYTSVLGIVIGRDLRHGVNYMGLPFDDEHIKQLQTIKTSVERNVWIKVDIRMNWAKHTHDVYVDDIRSVHDSPFHGDGIRALSLSNYYEGGNVWFDEIYVGDDTTMGFVCPTLSNDGKLHIDRPIERGWSLKEVGDTSSLRPMQRHESHISRRAMYQRADNKFVVPFDGEGEANFTSDVKFRSKDGDRIHKKGKFHPGSLLRLPRDESSNKGRNSYGSYSFGMHPDTFAWYGEHDYNVDPRKLSGAVMACSTQDFVRDYSVLQAFPPRVSHS